MPSFFIVKCKWHPVVAPFVNLPEESLKAELPCERYLGPTFPIISPVEMSFPRVTI